VKRTKVAHTSRHEVPTPIMMSGTNVSGIKNAILKKNILFSTKLQPFFYSIKIGY